MIQGYATRDGTLRFRVRHEGKSTAIGHFKEFQGLSLTSIGMGTYLGNADATTDKLVVNAIKRSVASGAVNVIDTAINYRFQKAERALGRAVRELIEEKIISRDEIFISTKNGYLTHDADLALDFWEYIHEHLIKKGVITANDISSDYNCMKVSYLEDQLNRSIKNLGLECIDLMYLHNVIESNVHDIDRDEVMKMLKEAFEFYEQKRSEGVIKYYGMATWTCFRVMPNSREYVNLKDMIDMAKEASVRHKKDEHGLRFIQLPFNLIMHEAATLRNQSINNSMYTVFEASEVLGINVFTSVPLMQSRLLKSNVIPTIDGIESKALRCLQFVRSSPAIPLVGHKNPEHVEENIRIAKIKPLSTDEFNNILAGLVRTS